ncbi:MAG: right-handed parallel beta-helix repeat-containing protein, partial [Planctomycetota bacterium]
DLSNPDLIVTGQTHLTLEELENGTQLKFIVRARDGDLEIDPNENEWPVTPNPVCYVQSGANPVGADGLTPETAYPLLAQAIAASIGLNGVNFHVTEGLYPENIFLFPGMMLFGGFPVGFGLDQRDPDLHLTQFGILFPSDLVQLRPGSLLNGIDGISLAGNDIAESCVFAEDCNARITRCLMSGAITQGIDLRSDHLEGEKITAFIADCVVADCSGEGIRIQGIPEIRIDDCEIRNNFNEGIESQWIRAGTDTDACLEITRCLIRNNGDEGIDLDISPIDELSTISQQGGNVRIRIRHCSIEENLLEGIVIDLDTRNFDGMDIRVRIDDSRIRANGMSGIFLDGDADAAFRISRCLINSNHSFGVLATGLATGPLISLHHCNIIGNGAAGLATVELGSLSAWHCWVEGNAGGIFSAPRGSITFHDSILAPGTADLDTSSIQYSLIAGEAPATELPVGVVHADPALVGRPIGYSRAMSLPDGSILIHQPPPISDNLFAEIADDGILRQVISSNESSLTLEPAPGPVAANSSIFFWHAGEGPTEDPTPLPGSPIIQTADPSVTDLDGFPFNLGPLGNNPLHFIGPDPALPEVPDENQLFSISPAPSMPSIYGHWDFSFTRDLPLVVENSISLNVDGVDRSGDLAVQRIGSRLVVKVFPQPQAGQKINLEILPFDGDGFGNHLPRRIYLQQETALLLNENEISRPNDLSDTAEEIVVSPLIVYGKISSFTDEDWFRLIPQDSGPYQIELIARRDGSPLNGKLEWFSSDGATLLDSAESTGPFFFDPFLL